MSEIEILDINKIYREETTKDLILKMRVNLIILRRPIYKDYKMYYWVKVLSPSEYVLFFINATDSAIPQKINTKLHEKTIKIVKSKYKEIYGKELEEVINELGGYN